MFRNFLFWPDQKALVHSPQIKTNQEKLPSVATSEQWIEIHKLKQEEKDEMEKVKYNKRKEKEQKKSQKIELVRKKLEERQLKKEKKHYKKLKSIKKRTNNAI